MWLLSILKLISDGLTCTRYWTITIIYHNLYTSLNFYSNILNNIFLFIFTIENIFYCLHHFNFIYCLCGTPPVQTMNEAVFSMRYKMDQTEEEKNCSNLIINIGQQWRQQRQLFRILKNLFIPTKLLSKIGGGAGGGNIFYIFNRECLHGK